GFVGRRMAEARHRSCLYARGGHYHPRRADGRARRAGRSRSLLALQVAERKRYGAPHLPPLLDRPDGRPHRCARGRQGARKRDSRRAYEAARTLRRTIRASSRRLQVIPGSGSLLSPVTAAITGALIERGAPMRHGWSGLAMLVAL